MQKIRKREQDKARAQTDKILAKMEQDMGRIYDDDPALRHAKKKYAKYMQTVQERTQGAYKAYLSAEDKDTKDKAKDAYMDEIRGLTVQSKEYNAIIKEITQAMAQANQSALDVVNDAMVNVYAINYNQVADECRRVGIKVNG